MTAGSKGIVAVNRESKTFPSSSDRPTVLLINPWIYDFAAYDFWAKPLGLLSIGSLLRCSGYRVVVIDCLARPHSGTTNTSSTTRSKTHAGGTGKFLNQPVEKPVPLKNIQRRYRRYGIALELFELQLEALPDPAAVLVTSSMTYWYPGVFDVIRLAKRRYPKVPVILGGTYATLCRDHAQRFSGADVVIAGPGEQATLHILDRITATPPAAPGNDLPLGSFPYPAFDLLDQMAYLCIETSRGCPFACHYCASGALFPGYLRRSPTSVVDEIQFWNAEYHVHDFAFYDDALLFDAENHIVPVLQDIIRRNLECRFHTPNGMHLRFMTPALAELMIEAGFSTIRFGLETSDDERSARLGAKTSREHFLKAVRWLHQAGYAQNDIGTYLLAGLPGQKASEVRNSISFVRDSGARPYLAEYSPIPGTRLWNDAIKTSPFDIAHEPLFHNNSILPCQWEHFTLNDLQYLKMLARS